MNEAFRLSRIRSPRATLTAALLLAAVFIVFGLLIYGIAPEAAAAPRHVDYSSLALTHWLAAAVGPLS